MDTKNDLEKGIKVEVGITAVDYDGYTWIPNVQNGYLQSNVKKQGTMPLHKYVWIKFNGSIPDGYIIHHQDGNIYNNLLTNLVSVTRAEHLAIHRKDKAFNKSKKLNISKVKNDDTGIIYDSIAQAGNETGTNKVSIWYVLNNKNKRKSAGGFKWSYYNE